jgi:hypothetical protein
MTVGVASGELEERREQRAPSLSASSPERAAVSAPGFECTRPCLFGDAVQHGRARGSALQRPPDVGRVQRQAVAVSGEPARRRPVASALPSAPP